MADIFDTYQPADAWDEMFEQPGLPRGPYQGLVAALQPLDPAELRYRADQLARIFTDRGVTFDYACRHSRGSITEPRAARWKWRSG